MLPQQSFGVFARLVFRKMGRVNIDHFLEGKQGCHGGIADALQVHVPAVLRALQFKYH